jgi:hypothetical protein
MIKLDNGYVHDGFVYIEYDGNIEVFSPEYDYMAYIEMMYDLSDYSHAKHGLDYYAIKQQYYHAEYIERYVNYMIGRCTKHWHDNCHRCKDFFTLQNTNHD